MKACSNLLEVPPVDLSLLLSSSLMHDCLWSLEVK